MRKNPLNKGIIMENAAGIGTVTSEMVEARARELAAISSFRWPCSVLQDLENVSIHSSRTRVPP
jgi:hypothetical protein